MVERTGNAMSVYSGSLQHRVAPERAIHIINHAVVTTRVRLRGDRRDDGTQSGGSVMWQDAKEEAVLDRLLLSFMRWWWLPPMRYALGKVQSLALTEVCAGLQLHRTMLAGPVADPLSLYEHLTRVIDQKHLALGLSGIETVTFEFPTQREWDRLREAAVVYRAVRRAKGNVKAAAKVLGPRGFPERKTQSVWAWVRHRIALEEVE